jgi:hypothetical protein
MKAYEATFREQSGGLIMEIPSEWADTNELFVTDPVQLAITSQQITISPTSMEEEQ